MVRYVQNEVPVDRDPSPFRPPLLLADARPRPQEELLVALLDEFSATRVLCTSAGWGQLAQSAARRWPRAAVHCHYLDLYRAQQARHYLADGPENLTIGCAADFPSDEVDLVALPLSAQGEAELVRDWLQAGHETLVPGGHMIVSTDNPRDQWLHAELKKLFDDVACRREPSGAVYIAKKTRALKKLKSFACDFVFRDRERLIHAFSRPGVFSHRRVDPGARQLMAGMEIRGGQRVLDIGCGCGVLSLAAALRGEGVHVHAVDSNARAVECTRIAAERNGLAHVVADLNASGDYPAKGSFDLVLANPPYYADFQIARLFVLAGRAALRPGGTILVVTKSPDWYRQQMPAWFDRVEVEPSKQYHVVRAVR